jgi:hypothetical protein
MIVLSAKKINKPVLKFTKRIHFGHKINHRHKYFILKIRSNRNKASNF